MNPPEAPEYPEKLTFHNDTRTDPWYWLRDRDHPETIPYLEAENRYTESVMKDTEVFRKNLVSELRGRIKEEDESVPMREGDYWYYSRYEKNRQYPVFCRKKHSLEEQEEVTLDVNLLAEKSPYCQLGALDYSPDHRFLLYSVDLDGAEKYTVFVKDLESGTLLQEEIPNTFYSTAWVCDSSGFLYTVLDEKLRPTSAWLHRLNTDIKNDICIYEEKDSRFFVSVDNSQSQKYIFIHTGGNNMDEWYFLPGADPESELTLIFPREKDHEYDINHHEDRFIIRTNYRAKDFRVMETPVTAPSRENWKELIPASDGVLIEDCDIFRTFMVVSLRRKGLPILHVYDFSSDCDYEVEMDEETYDTSCWGHREYDIREFRYAYSSLTTPETVYDFNLDSRSRERKKQKEIPDPSFSPEHYQSRRIYAKADDGAEIPISLMFHRDTPLDGSAPLYLYGYGSYGASMDASFGHTRLSYVDRGFVYAIAHIRGGMELGWDWYERGRLFKKMNTFTDFIRCAEFLIGEGYTAQGRITAAGGSAGGMLMGAVLNMRPELFSSVLAHVPFVDVLTTMLDDSLPLTTMEYNEWGNPHEKDSYFYIKRYSPYDNVSAQDYPAILITAGLNDPRVTYWEPAKWCAKLRKMKTDSNLLLLKTHMGFGHAGASGRFDYLEEIALDIAFVLKTMGVCQ